LVVQVDGPLGELLKEKKRWERRRKLIDANGGMGRAASIKKKKN